ncbi:MAG: M50 family metallopeptidase [Myxococcaceae bacterium]|nr:M50 family metallopeptidase [Myxococcaceae bacterium]
MFRDGFLQMGTWRNIPLRVHWSTPLGALFFGRFEFVPVFWLAFFLLILFHEMGHALVVRRLGGTVYSLDVSAFGGLCRWAGHVSPIGRACIAWGGVWAQLLLFAGTQAAIAVHGAPTTLSMGHLVHAFTVTNWWIMLLNLIPVPPLDGAEAWRLFPLLHYHWQRKRSARRAARAKAKLLRYSKQLGDIEARLGEPATEINATVAELFAELKNERYKH